MDLDLILQPGEVVAVLGPNGAGKTTLLRSLAGLNPLQSGQIRISDRIVDDADAGVFVPPDQRQVGLVFQNYRLFPHLDVRDNVGFSTRARGGSRSAARASAEPWIARLGLSDLADRRPRQLSGGQSQRVVIARALASDPELLLLDEPLAALDHRTRTDVRAALRDHLSAFAGPVLIVTHDPIDAMVLADRLIVIEGGHIVQDGPPAEVARRPLTGYVARLVGLNLYEGQQNSATPSIQLTGGGELHATAGDEPIPDGPVMVTVRPTAISLHREHPGPGSPRNVWPGQIDGIETLGDRVRLSVSGAPPAVVDLTPDAVVDLDLRIGRDVWLSAKATEVLAYPAR